MVDINALKLSCSRIEYVDFAAYRPGRLRGLSKWLGLWPEGHHSLLARIAVSQLSKRDNIGVQDDPLQSPFGA